MPILAPHTTCIASFYFNIRTRPMLKACLDEKYCVQPQLDQSLVRTPSGMPIRRPPDFTEYYKGLRVAALRSRLVLHMQRPHKPLKRLILSRVKRGMLLLQSYYSRWPRQGSAFDPSSPALSRLRLGAVRVQDNYTFPQIEHYPTLVHAPGLVFEGITRTKKDISGLPA